MTDNQTELSARQELQALVVWGPKIIDDLSEDTDGLKD